VPVNIVYEGIIQLGFFGVSNNRNPHPPLWDQSLDILVKIKGIIIKHKKYNPADVCWLLKNFVL